MQSSLMCPDYYYFFKNGTGTIWLETTAKFWFDCYLPQQCRLLALQTICCELRFPNRLNLTPVPASAGSAAALVKHADLCMRPGVFGSVCRKARSSTNSSVGGWPCGSVTRLIIWSSRRKHTRATAPWPADNSQLQMRSRKLFAPSLPQPQCQGLV